MECPKCGYQRTEEDQDKPKSYCPSCGVIYEKAQSAHLKKVAVQQKAKEEELQRREQELKKREATLQGKNSPAIEKGTQSDTPITPPPVKQKTKPPATYQKPTKVGAFTRYFVFVLVGIPCLFALGGAVEDGFSENWVTVFITGSLFFFLLIQLPPIQNAINKNEAKSLASGRVVEAPTTKGYLSGLFGFGIVAVVAFFCLSFLKTCFAPMAIDIENGIAKREVIVSPLYNVGVVADTINNQACKIVEENSGIKGVELTVYLDGESVSDKYGNKADTNLYMGTVKIDDLAEVRKYKSCSDYSYAMRSKIIAKVNTMKFAGSLK